MKICKENKGNIINPMPFLLLTVLTLSASFYFLVNRNDSICISLVFLAVIFSLVPSYMNLKMVKERESEANYLMKKLNGQTSTY